MRLVGPSTAIAVATTGSSGRRVFRVSDGVSESRCPATKTQRAKALAVGDLVSGRLCCALHFLSGLPVSQGNVSVAGLTTRWPYSAQNPCFGARLVRFGLQHNTADSANGAQRVQRDNAGSNGAGCYATRALLATTTSLTRVRAYARLHQPTLMGSAGTKYRGACVRCAGNSLKVSTRRGGSALLRLTQPTIPKGWCWSHRSETSVSVRSLGAQN